MHSRGVGFVKATLFGLLVLAAPSGTLAQGPESIKKNYDKHEYQIPMRDGVKLFTSVYTPKDGSKKYPILLERTPYSVGPYGEGKFKGRVGPSAMFAKARYIFAYQDVRGCFMSEGKFVDVRPYKIKKTLATDFDESTDAFDTIDWLVKNVPNNNGKVGMWGISYPGFYAAAALIESHPALAAVSPQGPVTDWFLGDDTHHNGALYLLQEFNFDASFVTQHDGPSTKTPRPFRHGTNDAYQFFLNMGPVANARKKYLKGEHAYWDDVMNHGTYDDFWKARTLLPNLRDVKPAVMTVGGWFDGEDLWGALHTYKAIEQANPKADNFLVMGPWEHGGWADDEGDTLGPINFQSQTKRFFQRGFEFAFFEHYLKDQGTWRPTEAFVFETGRNRWHRHSEWPPKEADRKSIYLGSHSKLEFDPPAKPIESEFDEYMSDPFKPVPFTNTIAIDCPSTFMVEDQRFAGRRPDVLVYQTDPLEKDLTIAGPIEAELWVSTGGTDSDWVVKVIDVLPESGQQAGAGADADKQPLSGYQMLVRGEVMRGKFREGFDKPKPFVPNEPAKVKFTLPDVYHTFLHGHKLMVQVQSSWFPLVDRNPQTFVDIYKAGDADFKGVIERVYHSPERASRIEVLVVP